MELPLGRLRIEIMSVFKLTQSEERSILRNPYAIECLLDYHDRIYSEAESQGIEVGPWPPQRYLELKELGKKIIEEDPECFDESLVTRFGVSLPVKKKPCWIENCSSLGILCGFHQSKGPDTILIQITGICGTLYTPAESFAERYHFEFEDVTPDTAEDPEMLLSEEDAKSIDRILKRALGEGKNVVVQCHGGVSRSSGVVEHAILLGFERVNNYGAPYTPNMYVKHLLNSVGGVPFDPNEKSYVINR